MKNNTDLGVTQEQLDFRMSAVLTANKRVAAAMRTWQTGARAAQARRSYDATCGRRSAAKLTRRLADNEYAAYLQIAQQLRAIGKSYRNRLPEHWSY